MRVALLLRLAVVGDVDLAAEDRLDALLLRLPDEVDRAGERAVVGERHRRHLELGRAGRERRDPARPVEDRVLGVDVEMDEIGRSRHGKLILERRSESARSRPSALPASCGKLSGDARLAARAYGERFMSAAEATLSEQKSALPTLEIVWQQEPHAFVFLRDAEGGLTDGQLEVGAPASADLTLARGVPARRVDVRELVALAADPPPGELELGGSAQGVFALVALAHRSLAEGLVHPYLDHGDGDWHAFWGATLDSSVQAALADIAAALPPVAADAFDGDRDATGARPLSRRRRPHRARPAARRPRQAARRICRGARRRSSSSSTGSPLPTRSCRPTPATRRCGGSSRAGCTTGSARSRAARRRRGGSPSTSTSAATGIVLELWLQAEDDPSLSLPASLVWEGGDIFSFLRASDPQTAFVQRLAELEPLLTEHDIHFDGAEATEALLDADAVGRLPARRDAAARGEGRAGAAAGRVGALAEPAAPRT